MHHHYEDIRDRISEPPKWWDEDSVPRYCDFSPHEVADIYADEVALVTIACQACLMPFLVAFSRSVGWKIMSQLSGRPVRSLAESIRDKSLHYGDPPNFGCCPAGPTMNCNDIRVVEYWRRERVDIWERDPSLEIALADG